MIRYILLLTRHYDFSYLNEGDFCGFDDNGIEFSSKNPYTFFRGTVFQNGLFLVERSIIMEISHYREGNYNRYIP
jgi:hypothetical protein